MIQFLQNNYLWLVRGTEKSVVRFHFSFNFYKRFVGKVEN